MSLARRCNFAIFACAAAWVGCNGSDDTKAYTYYQDAQPIIAAKCAGCHVEGGIAPFPLTTYEEVYATRGAIEASVLARTMPPWPPSQDCNTYQHDRSLSTSEYEAITGWLAQGAPKGSASAGQNQSAQTAPGLDRVDLELSMPESYTPTQSPDDYRCFLLDWPESTDTYVTGYDVIPGEKRVVHHVIAFLAPPSARDEYVALDAAESGPGYTCFGGTGGSANGWIATWTPGESALSFPAGTGIKIEPGATIILQVHYNTSESVPLSDQTSLQFRTEASVTTPAVILPFTDFAWIDGNGMRIPAGNNSVVHSYAIDPTPFFEFLSELGVEGVLTTNAPFKIHSANFHMHQLGKHGRLSIDRAGPSRDETCLMDIPQWDFDWQGTYWLQDPVTFNPGDRLRITCEWDNSASNQPFINGEQLVPRDVKWGEGTTDEMCLAGMYVTAAN